METRTIERGPLSIHIKWVEDEQPLFDFIGKYSEGPCEEGWFDRKLGVLYGEAAEEPEEPDPDDFYRERTSREFLEGAREDTEGRAAYDAAFELWQERWNEWNNHLGLEVLAEVRTRYSNCEYRFFKPYAGGERPGSEYFIKYALQDWERITGLEQGTWCYMGCVVTVCVEGIEVGHDALWGIGSDCGEECVAETEGQCIVEAIHGIPEMEKCLARVAEILEKGEWGD